MLFARKGAYFQTTWNMSDEQCADWSEIMTRRLRNLIHRISVAEYTTRKPDWVIPQLPWPSSSTAPTSEDKPEEGAEHYYLGCKSELRLAYRVKHSDNQKNPDLNKPPPANRLKLKGLRL